MEDERSLLKPTAAFTEAFAGLTTEVGRQVDASDEHARLEIYRSLLPDAARRPQLVACLALEPDRALATSVLASLLEAMAPPERHRALSAAPDTGRDFLATRARELGVLEAATAAGEADVAIVEQVVAGSDWLQRRVSERAPAAGVLAALAERGRTRKVRARAAERARQISPG